MKYGIEELGTTKNCVFCRKFVTYHPRFRYYVDAGKETRHSCQNDIRTSIEKIQSDIAEIKQMLKHAS